MFFVSHQDIPGNFLGNSLPLDLMNTPWIQKLFKAWEMWMAGLNTYIPQQ